MVLTSAILLVTVGAILVLPWTLRQAGIFDRVRKGYYLLLAGLFIGLIATMMLVYENGAVTRFLPQAGSLVLIRLIVETVAGIISTIGLLLMVAKVLE